MWLTNSLEHTVKNCNVNFLLILRYFLKYEVWIIETSDYWFFFSISHKMSQWIKKYFFLPCFKELPLNPCLMEKLTNIWIKINRHLTPLLFLTVTIAWSPFLNFCVDEVDLDIKTTSPEDEDEGSEGNILLWKLICIFLLTLWFMFFN